MVLSGSPDGSTSGATLDFAVDAIGGVLIVEARGALVQRALGALRECLTQAARGGRPVVLDLAAIDRADPAAVEMLLDAHRRLATRMRMVVERGGPVHEALKQAGVAHVVAMHPSRAAALTAAAPRT